MKAIFVLLSISFLFGVVSALNFDGVYLDGRLGGLAYICTNDSSRTVDGEPFNADLQGTASGKVIFTSSDYSYSEGYIRGKYYEAGPTPREGTFGLYANDDASVLSGWYYPKDEKHGTGWPWVLYLQDPTDPSTQVCLYRQVESDVPDINGEWGGALGSAHFCNDDEGSFTFTQNAQTAYVTGESHDDDTIIVGRIITGEYPESGTSSKVYCADSESLNFLVKVISVEDDASFAVAGWINNGNIYAPPNQNWYLLSSVDSEEDKHCASDNNADKLGNCETGEVGGPILNIQRNSAAGLTVSFVAIVATLFVTLF